MAEDMIERVARRLWNHSFDRAPDPPWEQTTELQKRFNRMLAREVVAEMREPTPHMIDVGWSLIRGNLRPDEIYPHMIDAALDPKQPGEK